MPDLRERRHTARALAGCAQLTELLKSEPDPNAQSFYPLASFISKNSDCRPLLEPVVDQPARECRSEMTALPSE
ncbi:hypothetical protein [Streptomyces sp. NPDC059861]|uniref:hypothetical protein n=1 Tax=Streptomyces sp. NPDC059861 TaxID=3346974 RepID=UPI00364DDB89